MNPKGKGRLNSLSEFEQFSIEYIGQKYYDKTS